MPTGRTLPTVRRILYSRITRRRIFSVNIYLSARRRIPEILIFVSAAHCKNLKLNPGVMRCARTWLAFVWLSTAVTAFPMFFILKWKSGIFFKLSQLGAHYFLVYLFQLLYMFRATMWPSAGELAVSMRHWYFSLCMGGCLVYRTDRHPYRVKNTSVAQIQ